jgi:hypothetical protein
MALTALQGSTCRSLFRGKNPENLLADLFINGRLRIGRDYAFPTKNNPNNRRNFDEGTGAVMVYSGVRILPSGTRQSAPVVTINERGHFFTGRVSGVDISTRRNSGHYGLNISQIRGSIIIHELLHIAGTIPDDDPSSLNDNSRQSMANSELVRLMCFSPLNNANTPLQQAPLNINTGAIPLIPLSSISYYPSWWYSMLSFNNWVNSITTETMDNPTVTVCYNGDCV